MRSESLYHRMQDAAPATHVEALALPSALLASVSHDLRNPLAVILGAAEALQETGAHLDEDAHGYLRAIRRECIRMDEYVRGLFNVTRLLVSGGTGLAREPVEVQALAESAVERPMRYRGGARVVLDVPASLRPVRVHGVLLEQALLNVLDNAAKFGVTGSEVRLQIRQSAGHTEIDVVDSGPGIQADARMPGMRPDEERPSGGRMGSGLGLAIARSVFRAHGGDVVADNRTDGQRGTRVRLTIPNEATKEAGAP